MAQLGYPLLALAWPVGVSVMLPMMMRGGWESAPTPPPMVKDQELAALRAEVAALQTAQDASTAPVSHR